MPSRNLYNLSNPRNRGRPEMDNDLKLSRERRLVLWLLVFATIGFALYLLRAALLPFVVGMAVAYLLDPLADRLERLGCPRGLAAFAIVFTFLLVIAAALVVLVPVLSDQVTGLISHVPEYVDSLRRESAPFLRRMRSIICDALILCCCLRPGRGGR